jgi:hypothetical protein
MLILLLLKKPLVPLYQSMPYLRANPIGYAPTFDANRDLGAVIRVGIALRYGIWQDSIFIYQTRLSIC